MDPQDKQPYNNDPSQPIQTENSMEELSGETQLSLIGLILAVLFPPAGLVVSIIALRQAKRDHLQGRGKAIVGIVLSAIFITLPFLFFAALFFILGGLRSNEAKENIQPLITEMQNIGGTELCDNGDSGYGIDNTQPWYQVYYSVPDSVSLTEKVKTIAMQSGYQLDTDESSINILKTPHDADSGYSMPGDGFNPKSDYLAAEDGDKYLKVTINRQTSVTLYCKGKEYGKKRPTGNNNTIVDVHLSAPHSAFSNSD